ncbi:calmodulin-binding receptor kinase CaMRLK-like [Impatiens glandulifera]|uniref:calmodulin-binding receptor kinase CaMRLK-like n=1 Tax=Impatiens glandulifera TaxID=253017 RepID=UPI001FB0E407|nr:calmodulin-binding receptor kinase CaMRLK-like [Impatiens glandulifera]
MEVGRRRRRLKVQNPKTKMKIFLTLMVLFISLISAHSSSYPCNNSTDQFLISKAFSSVAGFNPSFLRQPSPSNLTCTDPPPITSLNLSSKNLTGLISWKFLRNLSHLQTIDLSNNSLKGSVPGWFWTLPTLINVNLSNNRFGGTIRLQPISKNFPLLSSIQTLNLSFNRFTNLTSLSVFPNLTLVDLSNNDLKLLLPFGFSGLTKLQHLDVSGCNLSGNIKPISDLQSLHYLDLSDNKMKGYFPSDFPPISSSMKFLNISFNNFTGVLSSYFLGKFGRSSFIQAGNLSNPPNQTPVLNEEEQKPHLLKNSTHKTPHFQKRNTREQKPRSKMKHFILMAVLIPVITVIGVLSCVFCCIYKKRDKARRSKLWSISISEQQPVQVPFKIDKAGPFSFETESGISWVAEIREPSSAAVVMFEKPLMSLTFRDLIAATAGFGRESLLSEGRCGPVYRAVLPGDIHVAIKVLKQAKSVCYEEAVAKFEGLARLRHPNLLPISGYCIAGKQKLVLYEFMANGDLRNWLHELPVAPPINIDDWTADTWDNPLNLPSPEKTDWLTRHRIAVGLARGLAFLHHAGSRPVIHGHLVPSNILLGDNFDPRISDFGFSSETNVGSTEADVFNFGAVLVELVTGKEGSDETVGWVRRMVKDGSGVKAIDPRLIRQGEKSEVGKMVEFLRVGYLCTAETPGKRPTMKQVVGMLKDVHPFTEDHN